MVECRARLSGINPWREKQNGGHGSPGLILFEAGSVWARRNTAVGWLGPGEGGASPHDGSPGEGQVNELHAWSSSIAYHGWSWIVGSLVVRLVVAVASRRSGEGAEGGGGWLGVGRAERAGEAATL